MNLTNATVELINDKFSPKCMLKHIEIAGRLCYKSEISNDSEQFIRQLIKNGHESVLEHQSLTFKIICDRGVTHELVRHRIASYSQESTRYCNYSKDRFGGEISFINIAQGLHLDKKQYTHKEFTKICNIWAKALEFAEKCYMELIDAGATPQIARDVLPNSTKTEIIVTMNLREWRHFMKLRCDIIAHPQMREIANQIYYWFIYNLPVIVEDIMEVVINATSYQNRG